jgi:UDPglucose 6-dehydrogenase
MHIMVIGTGYVGLVQGACLASKGHTVTCVDIDEQKVSSLRNGVVPFFEEGLEELVQQGTASGALQFALGPEEGFSQMTPEVIFLAVGTPTGDDGSADLSSFEAATKSLIPFLKEGMILVEKSTVPVGTGKRVQEWLGRTDVFVASNPEFLREGTAVSDFLNPDRIVVGADNQSTRDRVAEVYAWCDAPVMTMNRESAELAKYAANTMLAARLSLMNEIANIADRVGANIREVENVVGADPRIGPKFLRTGAGFGGSCFPKDVLALEKTGRDLGYESKLIQPIIEVNKRQAEVFVSKIKEAYGDLAGVKLAAWGLAFNAKTDDTRESPAIRIIQGLVKLGAEITVYDPAALEEAKHDLGDTVVYTEDQWKALNGAQGLLVLTEWEQFINADWDKVKELLTKPKIFDGKHQLPAEKLRDQGFTVIGIGI